MTMTEDSKIVDVPFGDDPSVTAQNLLAAAERLELDPSVVAATSKGLFRVPAEVAEEAGAYIDRSEDDESAEAGEKSLEDYTNKELEKLAEDEDIDLTGAKQSKATRIARIEEKRAEKAEPEPTTEPTAEPTTDGETPAGDPEE